MNVQGRIGGGRGPRIGAGIVAVLGGGVSGALAVLGVVTGVATSSSTAQAQQHPATDGGVPAYIVAAGQGLVTPPDVEDVEHMCALLTSCPNVPLASDLLPSSVPGCVQSFMNELTSPGAVKYPLIIRECGLRANSCSELRTCMLRGARSDVCEDRGKNGMVGRCDDDGRAINCSHEKVVGVRDCPRGGEQCVVREGQASCVLGPCSSENKEGAPATCSASGTRVLRCDHGKLSSLDCTTFGLKCSVAEGSAGCATSTPPCSGTSKHCDGNVSVGCMHGHEVRVDCGAAGLTCNPTPGSIPVGACAAPPPAGTNDKCDPKDPPKCDGATIKYCFAGRKRSYFCKSLGFNGCVKDGSSVHCGG
ncbi:MAG: hypothetical protein ACLQVI_27845 [Polyangiaceae bacterium]